MATNPTQLLPARGSCEEATSVAELVSHPYKDYARHIMKVSYNIGADTSLMLFGLARGATTLTGALASEQEELATRFGIAADQVNFLDGSGDGMTAATAAAVVKLLRAMRLSPNFGDFLDAQPRLAIDGSLSFVTDFEADASLAGAKGQVHGKTGTYIAGTEDGPVYKAQALAGYIVAKSGRRLAFSLTVNDVGLIDSVDAILPVFQDEGTIAAILWKTH